MPTIALVDDHPLFRMGLRSALTQHGGLSVLVEAGDAKSAAPAIAAAAPDVVVVDLKMPGGSGVMLTRELVGSRPGIRILALSASVDDEEIAEAFEAGMRGYAIKSQPVSDIVEAIYMVAAGRTYLAPAISPAVLEGRKGRRAPAALRCLTRREREVFDLTVEGLSSELIARKLFISHRTVETHRSRILHKVGARGTVELVRIAARLGLIGDAQTAG
jgi:DNA-binding NarL/FixJ family response regulator